MEKIITCRDVGMDCRFEARALTEDETLTKIMRHVRASHTRDWFELEEIHATARSLLYGVAVCAAVIRTPMKTVILNGARNEDRWNAEISRLLVEEISSLGHTTDLLTLERIRIAPCTGCFGCWVKTPGMCVQDDAGRDVAKSALLCDLLVFLTPVTFGGYSSELKKAVDRLIPLLSPFFVKIGREVHHKPRYLRYPPILGVGLLPVPDQEKERIFRTLVERNAVNYHSPFHESVAIVPGQEETLRATLRAVVARCGGY